MQAEVRKLYTQTDQRVGESIIDSCELKHHIEVVCIICIALRSN